MPDDVNYMVRVSATDSVPQTTTESSLQPFSIDNVNYNPPTSYPDRWYFQVLDSPPETNLSMLPVELTQNEKSVIIDSAGDKVIGSWESCAMTEATSIAGTWTFSAWGKVDIAGLCSGHMQAKIYASSDPSTVIYATTLDDVDVGTNTAYTNYIWTDPGVTGSILSGDKIIVELLVNAASGSATSHTYDVANADLPVKGTVTNTFTATQNSDNTYESIEEAPGSTITFINEDMAGSVPPSGWTQDGPSSQWSQRSSSNAGGSSPEARFAYTNTVDVWHLYTPALDTSGMSSLNLQWRNMADDYGSGCTLKVQTSTDGSTWHDAGWSWDSGNGNDAASLKTLTLSTSDVGSSTFYVSWTVDGDAYQIDYWYIDDVLLTGVLPTALEHKWTIDVTGSTDEVLFGVEGYTTGESMDFYYSDTGSGTVGDSNWVSMLSVTKTSDDNTEQTFVLPISTSGTLYIGVIDALRSGDSTQDTLYVDYMYVRSTTAGPTFTFGYDFETTQSYVEPALVSNGVPYNIDLTGVSANTWVFVSFPIEVTGDVPTLFDDGALGDGLTTWDRIKWYDNVNKEWKGYNPSKPAAMNDMDVVDNTLGFWVHITAPGDSQLTIGIAGNMPTATTPIALTLGWNLVSYPSATINQVPPGDSVAYYNAAAPYLITDTTDPSSIGYSQGNAYWVHVTADTTWSVAP